MYDDWQSTHSKPRGNCTQDTAHVQSAWHTDRGSIL